MKTRILIATLLFIAMWRMDGAAKTPGQSVIGPSGLEVGEVVSSFPVGFDLMMAGGKQFVAFYDANRQMTVAVRNINSKKWKYRKLDSFIGWDSHNYITMTTDKEGYIHLSGNMHNDTLVYFRSEKPYDIRSLKRIPTMTGDDEYRVTYPAFMRDRDDNLIFHYRSGGSGDGYELYNIYDQKTRTWKRLINGALINGRSDNSTMSAYMSGPVLGPDGVFHLIWVWRNTGDCSSNHTLSYAKSPDLIHWESIRGEPMELPITLQDSVLYVDPTPVKGGLFNPGIKIGFDSQKRIIIGYHKFDPEGNNQLYIARFENNDWRLAQITDWKHRWYFSGYGSMPANIWIAAPYVIGDGKLAFAYKHYKEGEGDLLIDENTLKIVGQRPTKETIPAHFLKPTSGYPNMQVRTLVRNGYLLRWETMPVNQDRKPTADTPPTKLVLYKL